MVKLGSTVKDTVTGYTGIATARTVWMYGCARIAVDSKKLVKGKVAETQWFDEQRIQVEKGGRVSCGRNSWLGCPVKDSVTGFTGLVVAESESLYGRITIGVESQKLVDGKLLEIEWFDLQRLEIVRIAKPKVSRDSSAESGGPQNDPKQRIAG